MVYLFYCLAFPFVYFELYALINAREIIEESRNAQKVIEQVRSTGHGDGSNISAEYLKAILMDLCYVLWSSIGLLSSQWIFFVGLFLLTALSSLTRKRVYKEASLRDCVLIDRFNSLFSILLLCMIVLNKFIHFTDVPRSILEVLGVW